MNNPNETTPNNPNEGSHNNAENTTENAKKAENMSKESLEGESKEDNPSEQTQIEKLQLEVTAAKDKYLRLYSEFENFRRRTAKEKIETVQFANKNLLSALLPVLDDFERAEKSISEADDENQKAQLALDAIEILFKRFKGSLEQKGVKEMESAIGQELDTDLHEAITTIPAPSEEQKGKIIDQTQKGYYLQDKVLRFAQVVVAK